MSRKIQALARFTAAAAFGLSLAMAPALAKDEITIVGGPVGGGWYLIAGGMADILQSADPELSVKVVPGGGLVNPPRVSTGDVDFGLSLGVNDEMARIGDDPYDQKYDNVRYVATGFNVAYFQVLADPELDIERFDQIIERKVPIKLTTPGLQTMGGWTISKLFKQEGSSIDELKAWGGAHYIANYTRQTDLLRDNQANAVSVLLQVPAPSLVEIGTTRELRFVELSDSTRDEMINKFGYVPAVIPKGAYQSTKLIMPSDYQTIAASSALIVNADLPDDLVYRVTKALFENADRVRKVHKSMQDFVPEKVVQASTRGKIKLHPGAERYFKEQGYDYQ